MSIADDYNEQIRALGQVLSDQLKRSAERNGADMSGLEIKSKVEPLCEPSDTKFDAEVEVSIKFRLEIDV